MELTQSQTVHFSVEGEFVAGFARDLVLEKNWRGAMRTLQAATIPAMPLDDVVAILSGTSTLTNTANGGLKVVPQDPKCERLKRYLSTAHWQNAGILEVDGEFYRPYAVITGFTREDERPVLERMEQQEDWCRPEEFRVARARHYMRRPFEDKVYFDAGPQPVLMERVQGPAFWMTTFKNAAEALADMRSVRSYDIEQLGGGYKPVQFNTPDFYINATIDGYLLSTPDELSAADQEMLERIMQLRSEMVDDGPEDREDDDPWHPNETKYEDIARGIFYKSKVDKQAETCGGFFEMTTKEKLFNGEVQTKTYRIARAPFLLWAEYHNYKPGELPSWKAVCPSGLKMGGDNPMHTDWWVSAGMSPRSAYNHDHPLNRAAWRYAYGLAKTNGASCIKLAGKGKVTGPVVFPKPNEGVPAGSIAVVTHAGPEYELALMSACKGKSGAVIAEVGGKLAHLTIVSNELGARLVMMEGALTKLKEGDLVSLDLDTCQVLVHGEPLEDIDED
jgi:hypothetical protein